VCDELFENEFSPLSDRDEEKYNDTIGDALNFAIEDGF